MYCILLKLITISKTQDIPSLKGKKRVLNLSLSEVQGELMQILGRRLKNTFHKTKASAGINM